jgi:hypothetical protein
MCGVSQPFVDTMRPKEGDNGYHLERTGQARKTPRIHSE